MVVSNEHFLCSPLPGEMKSNLTKIFQMGWFNHHLDIPFFFHLAPILSWNLESRHTQNHQFLAKENLQPQTKSGQQWCKLTKAPRKKCGKCGFFVDVPVDENDKS